MNSARSPEAAALRTGLWTAAASLLASGTTLVCCALPALLVALGAGAVLAGLVSAVPQLVWLSAHKGLVFGISAGLLVAAGALLWRARRLPCPTDPTLARACARLRQASVAIYSLAVLLYGAGAFFAFGLPVITAS